MWWFVGMAGYFHQMNKCIIYVRQAMMGFVLSLTGLLLLTTGLTEVEDVDKLPMLILLMANQKN